MIRQKKSTILVTGGTGFVGYDLIKKLKKKILILFRYH